MTRPFTAAILSAAIALGSIGTAPAQAGNIDTKRLLGGIATVIILGATYDHFRDKAKRKDRRPSEPDWKPRPEAKTVPGYCIRRRDTRHGVRRYFSKSCLEQSIRHADRLPAACEIRVRDRGGRERGYDPRCLRDHGWRRV